MSIGSILLATTSKCFSQTLKSNNSTITTYNCAVISKRKGSAMLHKNTTKKMSAGMKISRILTPKTKVSNQELTTKTIISTSNAPKNVSLSPTIIMASPLATTISDVNKQRYIKTIDNIKTDIINDSFVDINLLNIHIYRTKMRNINELNITKIEYVLVKPQQIVNQLITFSLQLHSANMSIPLF